jgi:hypothetical protein
MFVVSDLLTRIFPPGLIGETYVWLMNGTSMIGNGPAGWAPGADWHIS